jgi:hypothetical protein
MNRDSRLKPIGGDGATRLRAEHESGGANGNRPESFSQYHCMAEYAGTCVCGRKGWAIPTGRAASLRPQPPSAFSQSGIPIARKGGA